MSHRVHAPVLRDIKNLAKNICEKDPSIKHSQALEIISKAAGYRNWNTCSALAEKTDIAWTEELFDMFKLTDWPWKNRTQHMTANGSIFQLRPIFPGMKSIFSMRTRHSCAIMSKDDFYKSLPDIVDFLGWKIFKTFSGPQAVNDLQELLANFDFNETEKFDGYHSIIIVDDYKADDKALLCMAMATSLRCHIIFRVNPEDAKNRPQEMFDDYIINYFQRDDFGILYGTPSECYLNPFSQKEKLDELFEVLNDRVYQSYYVVVRSDGNDVITRSFSNFMFGRMNRIFMKNMGHIDHIKNLRYHSIIDAGEASVEKILKIMRNRFDLPPTCIAIVSVSRSDRNNTVTDPIIEINHLPDRAMVIDR